MGAQFKDPIGYTCDNGGRPSNLSIFVGGFVLGGLLVGALGCVYAPQISKALTRDNRKELLRKLPKFIYDEEKALEDISFCSRQNAGCIPGQPIEALHILMNLSLSMLSIKACIVGAQKTRKILEQKIAELNTAIDELSFDIRGDDQPVKDPKARPHHKLKQEKHPS
ncbi:hypothetical protein ACLOJK_002795 [Asimina triloba]